MRRPRRRTLKRTLLCGLVACGLVALSGLAGSAADLDARLDPRAARHGGTTFRAAGRDPGAPRSLVLWRWNGTRFRRIAETHSTPAGDFDFGELPIPTSKAAYRVTAAGEVPAADALLWIERPVPAPVVLSGTLERDEIVLAPARYEGVIRLLDADSQRLLVRLPIDAGQLVPVAVAIDALDPRGRVRAVLIDQILDDGRRSRSVFVRLPRSDR